MIVTFSHNQSEADNIQTFFFEPERPLHYTAGQFIELSLPHTHEDDRGHERWFTLSSSPNDDLLSITTKLADGHRSSFKKALLRLKPGDTLHMSDPMGDFVLPKLIQTPLVFVAGGIGITPFRSMLSWLSQTEEERPIKLLYAVPTEDEIIFQETFAKADQHAVITVEHPSDAWGGERGILSAEKIIGLEEPSYETLVYVSGPEPMVEQLGRDLKKVGLKSSQLVLDFFPNYTTV